VALRLLLIQIDGLSSSRLRRAIAEGKVPSIAALSAGGQKLYGRTSEGPPSTPVFHGALLYGNQRVVHGYAWFDRRAGRVRRMDVPEDIALAERQLERQSPRRPLFRALGAAAYFTSFVGGAGRVAFTVATGLFPQRGFRTRQVVRGILRAARRLPGEGARSAIDFARHAGGTISMPSELGFLAMNILYATFFEEIGTRHAIADLEAGAPMVSINFVAYDEAAHRRGPDHAIALAQLPRIDARVAELLSAARERGYEVMVVSDHGQSAARPFAAVCGRSLAAVVYRACAAGEPHARFDRLVDRLEASRVSAASSRKWGSPLGVLLAARAAARARMTAAELERAHGVPAGQIAVVTGGSIAHVYVGRAPGGATLEEIRARFPRLLPALTDSPGVGLLVARKSARGPLVTWRGEVAPLLDEQALRALTPFRDVGIEILAGVLRRIVGAEGAGDLVVFGAFARAGAIAFDPEWGSHGGIHPDELDLFVIPPDGILLPKRNSLDPAELGAILRGRYGPRGAAPVPVDKSK
jgi:hypothetical protein